MAPDKNSKPTANSGKTDLFSWKPTFEDVTASLVVFLVALPLCMGIAVASGMPPVKGLITGIIGGIVVACFTGSPMQVSGPAAGLTVLILSIVLDPKLGLPMVGVLVLGAGVIQMAAGLAKLGRWFQAVPPSVVGGMLAGIGILIFVSQFHVLFHQKAPGSGLQNIIGIPRTIRKAFLSQEQNEKEERARIAREQAENDTHGTIVQQLKAKAPSKPVDPKLVAAELTKQTDEELRLRANDPKKIRQALLVGLASLVALLLWKALMSWEGLGLKKLKIVPAELLAVIAGALVLLSLNWDIRLAVEEHISLQGSVAKDFPSWKLVSVKQIIQPHAIGMMIAIAFIASAETLLCAKALDEKHDGARAKYDQEMFAQGVGNTLCGLVGALPMTGVIVRSSANLEAGAKTRWSAILHGVWLVLFVTLGLFILEKVPMAALSAILVFTGYKLVNPSLVRQLWEKSRTEVIIYAVTVIVIVAEGLLEGVIVGILLAAMKLFYQFSHLNIEVKDDPANNRVTIRPEGAATFLLLPKWTEVLNKVVPGRETHVDLEQLSFIDHACLDMLMKWEKRHELTGGTLIIDWQQLHATFHQENAKGKKKTG